jgi:hypothetical protein
VLRWGPQLRIPNHKVTVTGAGMRMRVWPSGTIILSPTIISFHLHILEHTVS